MKCVIIVFLWTFVITAQIKDDISIVQYSAEFVKSSELSLISFKDYNTQTLYLSKNQKIFKKEKIISLPTIVLYSDGEEILRIEGGISLSLPKNTSEQIEKQIDLLLKSRF